MIETLVTGLGFAEGLRWFDGQLWFSDFLTHRVSSCDSNGHVTPRAFIPALPSGLGFLPDGTPLVVSMFDRRLLAIRGDQLDVFADLRELATFPCNDMFVTANGTAYVGSFNYELWYEPKPENAGSVLLGAKPDGTGFIAADQLQSPNGIVLLPDEKTLVVAETHACRLTAFDIKMDGSLANRRLFADLGECQPDGLCADNDGNVWVSGLYTGKFMLVKEGGEILQVVKAPGDWAVSCALGGEDGRRLFVAIAHIKKSNDMRTGRATSSIHYVNVDSPACGFSR